MPFNIQRGAIAPVERPVQLDAAPIGIGIELAEVDALVRASEARTRFQVDGDGVTVAVLDTGLRTTHIDFAGRVPDQRNFTVDNSSDPSNASDGQGHGTNVAGIIAASQINIGIAPGARIVPVKVLDNQGSGDFEKVASGLDWVFQNADRLSISAVCMSLGDGQNHTNDSVFGGDDIQRLIRSLAQRRIAVVIAAGNEYYKHDSRQGMGYPAIFRESISVGAVYDSPQGPFNYRSGAVAYSTEKDRITPFSQRLHETVNMDCRTDIFAPGAPVTSSGILNDRAISIQHGTSQATPVVAGVVALMQQLHRTLIGDLPDIADIAGWLTVAAPRITDGDDEDDNVAHTNLTFSRIDAVAALSAIRRAFQMKALMANRGAPGSAFA